MKTAIIIVTFNRLELLKECISHALKQINQDVELFIVNNASTDGTTKYLQNETNKKIHVINLDENLGGAGGFFYGLKHAYEKSECDMFLLIDDDAMIECDYLDRIYKYADENYEAYSGSVIVNGKIDSSHRLFFNKGKVDELHYNEPFECDVATFCGLVVTRNLVEKIGFPRADFFIWHDDTEYCYRIAKYSKIFNVSDAQLNHKTNFVITRDTKLKDSWKEYYGIRNKLVVCRLNKEYKTLIKKMSTSLFKVVLFIFKAMLDKENRSAYSYNCQLRLDAVNDFLRHNMGKNVKYLP